MMLQSHLAYPVMGPLAQRKEELLLPATSSAAEWKKREMASLGAVV